MKYTVQYSERLDVYASSVSSLSRSFCQRLIEEEKILLNGKPANKKQVVVEGDEIEFLQTKPKELDLEPTNIPIDIVYQDQSIAVINKQQGLSVHAGNSYDNQPTLVNALLYHLDNLSSINGVIRPGIVHRLDKNTSGLLVVAKNDLAHKSLAEQIEQKTCRRTYIALLEGVLARSQYIFDRLGAADGVEGVCGLGLMIGIKTLKPAKEVVNKCLEKGVLVLTAKDKVRLLPPLNIDMKLLEKAVDVIIDACR